MQTSCVCKRKMPDTLGSHEMQHNTKDRPYLPQLMYSLPRPILCVRAIWRLVGCFAVVRGSTRGRPPQAPD